MRPAKHTTLPSLTFSLLACLGLLGCPGTLDDPERFLTESSSSGGGSMGCPDIEGDLFLNKCGTDNCHNAETNAGMLDLVSPGVAGRVNGVAGTDFCNMQVLADPNDPEGSLLVEKTVNPPCGSPMPLVGGALSQTEIDCLSDWVADL